MRIWTSSITTNVPKWLPTIVCMLRMPPSAVYDGKPMSSQKISCFGRVVQKLPPTTAGIDTKNNFRENPHEISIIWCWVGTVSEGQLPTPNTEKVTWWDVKKKSRFFFNPDISGREIFNRSGYPIEANWLFSCTAQLPQTTTRVLLLVLV